MIHAIPQVVGSWGYDSIVNFALWFYNQTGTYMSWGSTEATWSNRTLERLSALQKRHATNFNFPSLRETVAHFPTQDELSRAVVSRILEKQVTAGFTLASAKDVIDVAAEAVIAHDVIPPVDIDKIIESVEAQQKQLDQMEQLTAELTAGNESLRGRLTRRNKRIQELEALVTSLKIELEGRPRETAKPALEAVETRGLKMIYDNLDILDDERYAFLKNLIADVVKPLIAPKPEALFNVNTLNTSDFITPEAVAKLTSQTKAMPPVLPVGFYGDVPTLPQAETPVLSNGFDNPEPVAQPQKTKHPKATIVEKLGLADDVVQLFGSGMRQTAIWARLHRINAELTVDHVKNHLIAVGLLPSYQRKRSK